MFRRVSDGNVGGRGAALREQFARAAVEQNHWRTRFFRGDFDVLPTDAAAPSRLQSFQRRFFCRKTRGIMLCSDGAARFTVRPFGVGEDALGKARRAFDGFAHAANFDDVYSD